MSIYMNAESLLTQQLLSKGIQLLKDLRDNPLEGIHFRKER